MTLNKIMKGIFIGILCFSLFACQNNQAVNRSALLNDSILTISGKYTGKNIFIENFQSKTEEKKFTVKKVTVNNEKTTDEINARGIEIDFTAFNLKIDDAIKIEIEYELNNPPKILNPEVLK